MNIKAFLYAANMTNTLAKDIPEDKWNNKLIPELGTLRKLFIHIIRVRNVYREGLISGAIQFPGKLPVTEDIMLELEKSRDTLAAAFEQTNFEYIKMGTEYLSIIELQGTAIQHEGIHQGQYYVALKQAGFSLPRQWEQDWGLR
ncbi:DinB family protein [Virgibacillus oceani]